MRLGSEALIPPGHRLSYRLGCLFVVGWPQSWRSRWPQQPRTMALPPAPLHMTSEPVPWHPLWVHQNLGPCSTRCSEHLTGEPGPSLHSYLHPGAGDPRNKAMCIWRQMGASPGAAPTSQIHFKAGASSTECHRDLFLLLSLILPSTRSPPPAGLAQPWQHRAGRHFVPLLSLPLPGRALAPGTAAAPQDALCWGSSALPSPSCGWQGSDSPQWACSC